MTDHEVERALGYTPCVCGKIDGTWHPQCYRNKSQAQISAGYKAAFSKARQHLKKVAEVHSNAAIARATHKEQT